MFIHLVEIGIQSCGNPRDVWCYGDEDMLGDLVDIAEVSHPAYIHRVVIDRHRLWEFESELKSSFVTGIVESEFVSYYIKSEKIPSANIG